MMSPMFNVVVATPDVVGERMAGPGIRAWYFARELAKIAPVTLLARFDGTPPVEDGVAVPRMIDRRNPAEARVAVRAASVLIGQPVRGFRKRRRGQRIVYDLFDPLVLELRELYGNAPSLRQRVHVAAEWSRLVFALRHGDALIAATARQREFYGKLQTSDAPWLEVPFGIDLREVKRCPPAVDDVLLWGGGVWEWLDPKSAIDAVVALNREGLRCRLLFLGRSRPNAQVVDRRRESRFEQLLASGDGFVSANAEWVPYAERLSWLRACKIAIMLHRRTAEAEYSIRTRLFDAIAAGVPVITTQQGFAAELVERESVGIVVPPGDVGGVARAIRRLLTDDDFRAACVRRMEALQPRFAWEAVTRPLVEAVSEWQMLEK